MTPTIHGDDDTVILKNNEACAMIAGGSYHGAVQVLKSNLTETKYAVARRQSMMMYDRQAHPHPGQQQQQQQQQQLGARKGNGHVRPSHWLARDGLNGRREAAFVASTPPIVRMTADAACGGPSMMVYVRPMMLSRHDFLETRAFAATFNLALATHLRGMQLLSDEMTEGAGGAAGEGSACEGQAEAATCTLAMAEKLYRLSLRLGATAPYRSAVSDRGLMRAILLNNLSHLGRVMSTKNAGGDGGVDGRGHYDQLLVEAVFFLIGTGTVAYEQHQQQHGGDGGRRKLVFDGLLQNITHTILRLPAGAEAA